MVHRRAKLQIDFRMHRNAKNVKKKKTDSKTNNIRGRVITHWQQTSLIHSTDIKQKETERYMVHRRAKLQIDFRMHINAKNVKKGKTDSKTNNIRGRGYYSLA